MAAHPNVLYVLADDLGYGDVSCLNPEGLIPTPHLDRLAAEGLTFTDAHSSSAVCSPSRYSVLTGRYNWRSTLQRGIVQVYGDPLIAPDRLTVPALLGRYGYATDCIGKWHLGQGWDFAADEADFHPGGHQSRDAAQTAGPTATPARRERWREAFARPTTGGPTTRGFDRYFGVDVPNWPPYCFIEDDRTAGIPSEFLPAGLVGDHQASMHGPAVPGWRFEPLLPALAERAETVIGEHAAAGTPFFLYLPLTSPHTPLAVNEPWRGASGLDSRYADLVMETDAVCGRVFDALERHGVADDTLVVFASDNGCARYIGAPQLESRGHRPSARFRGYKSDAWDGGHRIPCLARWPGVIAPGSTCDQLVCLSDLMATCANIVGTELPPDAGEDSVDLLPLLRGGDGAVREEVVHHSIEGKFAIRDRRWKLILAPGSGGWTLDDAEAARAGLPLVQLYDMQEDPEERHNLQADEPERVRSMLRRLEDLVAAGRSTPGTAQANDVEVDIWKLDTLPGVDPGVLDDY